jgi:hypothetical protein
MPIAYSYARFSSKAQASGDSLRRQLSAAIEYADEHGLTLNTDLQRGKSCAQRGCVAANSTCLSEVRHAKDSASLVRGSTMIRATG